MTDAPPPNQPISAGELQRRAISGSTWTAIHTFVSLPIAFAANAIIARALGVSSYGHLAFLTASLTLAYAFANVGFSTAVMQSGSRAEASGRRNEADALLHRSLGFHMIVELPILIGVTLAFTRGRPWWEAVAALTAVTLGCALSSSALSITIQNRTAAAAQLAILVNLALQGSSVLTATLTRSPSAVWAVRMLVPSLALALNFVLLERGRRMTVLRPRLPRALGPVFWRYAFATWVAGLVGVLVFSRSEIFLLRALNRPEALGLFALAFGLGQQITAPVDAMAHALLPAVSGVLSEWPDRAAAAFDRSMRLSSLLSGGVAAAVVPALVFAVPLIYGSSFASAAWLFAPLALVSAFQSASNPVSAFANARQRGGLILKANVAALIVNLVAAVALILQFGVWGAVGANVAGQLVSIIWLVAAEPLAREIGPLGMLRLYGPFAYGVAVSLVAIGAGVLLEGSSRGLAAVAATGIGSCLYLVALRRSRIGLTAPDSEALLNAMGSRMRTPLALLLRAVTTGAS